MSTMIRPVSSAAIQLLAKPFFDAGAERVFVALCCDRVFVGVSPAQRCKKCRGTPRNVECGSAEQAAQLGTL